MTGSGRSSTRRPAAIATPRAAIGGAGVQIERRFGRFDNGHFDGLANKGGSLRQLFTVGSFTGSSGQSCNVPLEVEPRRGDRAQCRPPDHAAVRGRAHRFDPGLGHHRERQRATIVGARHRQPGDRPAAEPDGSHAVCRRNARRPVRLEGRRCDARSVLCGCLPERDGHHHAALHRRWSILDFATESKPNGIAQPAGCDDRGPGGRRDSRPGPTTASGAAPAGSPRSRTTSALFAQFMTFLAPAPRLPIDPNINLQGGTVVQPDRVRWCHLLKDYVTPAHPANGVPGNFSVQAALRLPRPRHRHRRLHRQRW